MKTAISFQQKKRNAAKLISCVVALAGITVIIGWIFDIRSLISIRPEWISMKFSTAFCFILSGVTLYFIARALEGELDAVQVILPITSLVLILFMGTFFFSFITGVHIGLEDLFFRDVTLVPTSVAPGRPSLPTMINFLLVAVASFLILLNNDSVRSKLRLIGFVISAVGLLAVIGYVFNVPLFYYYIRGINSAVACHTAILFVVLGAGFLCL